MLTQQAEDYHRQLLSSDEGLRWHYDRGLTDQTIRRFKLGWITEPAEGHERYAGSPVIPYVTLTGKVVELRVRRREGKPKYLRVGEDFPLAVPRFRLFNPGHALPSPRSDHVVICEGEYDTMAAVQAGLRAVGVPGATQWHEPWCYLFTQTRVSIAFDNDGWATDKDGIERNPGIEGAQRLAGLLTRHRVHASVVELPEGKDLGDLLLDGEDALRRAVSVRS